MTRLPEISVVPPGPRSRELAARLAAVESPAIDARRGDREKQSGEGQLPIVYERASGANVIDVDGNVYVDLAAGFGALLLGHSPPRVASAIEEQQQTLWLAMGDVYASAAKVRLCERLVKLYPEPGARVLLGTSGADAVTAALKTAVLATGRPRVVAFQGAYHGLSHGPLAACDLRPSYREPFRDQLNPHVTFVPYPRDAKSLGETLAAVERALAGGDVGAALVEPILGRAGCVVPPVAFLPALQAACRRSGALLIADEIWTGLGRSGAWLASTDAGAVPDLVCLGKGLGSGYPISACIGQSHAMAAWGAHGGSTIHTATHFGSPIACAAAIATLDAIEEQSLVSRAHDVGARLAGNLRQRLGPSAAVDVRGRGLMIGVEFEGDRDQAPRRALAAMRELLRRGWIVLTGGADGRVLTLTPPLDIDEALLDAFVDAFGAAIGH